MSTKTTKNQDMPTMAKPTHTDVDKDVDNDPVQEVMQRLDEIQSSISDLNQKVNGSDGTQLEDINEDNITENSKEGFSNKGYGIFSNDIGRNLLRTALIVLVLLVCQDKYAKDAIVSFFKKVPLPKGLKDGQSVCLIVVAISVYLILTFL